MAPFHCLSSLFSVTFDTIKNFYLNFFCCSVNFFWFSYSQAALSQPLLFLKILSLRFLKVLSLFFFNTLCTYRRVSASIPMTSIATIILMNPNCMPIAPYTIQPWASDSLIKLLTRHCHQNISWHSKFYLIIRPIF